jgi:hypothetical protein
MARNDAPGMRIDRYDFGVLVVDGREIRTDVLLTPGGVREHWWRREGHVLRLEDLGRLLDSHLERLIIGTGAFGRMRPDPALGPELAARGVTVEVLPTAAAVDRINELLRLGRGNWAGALHLTC